MKLVIKNIKSWEIANKMGWFIVGSDFPTNHSDIDILDDEEPCDG